MLKRIALALTMTAAPGRRKPPPSTPESGEKAVVG
jgi:hypothetical protein